MIKIEDLVKNGIEKLIKILQLSFQRIENLESYSLSNFNKNNDPLSILTRNITGYFQIQPIEKTVKSTTTSLPFNYLISMESVERWIYKYVKNNEELPLPGNQFDFIHKNYEFNEYGFTEKVNDIIWKEEFNERLFKRELDHSLIFFLNGEPLKYRSNSFQEVERILNKEKPGRYESSVSIEYRRYYPEIDKNINHENLIPVNDDNEGDDIINNRDKKNRYVKNKNKQKRARKQNKNENKKKIYFETNEKKKNKKRKTEIFKKILKNTFLPNLKSENKLYVENFIKNKNLKNQNNPNEEHLIKQSKILYLIKILYQMNLIKPKINNKNFIIKALNNKIKRQLDSIYVLFSGTTPRWIHELMLNGYFFLFDFQTRQKYFNRTCLGFRRTIKDIEPHLNRLVEKFRNHVIPRIPRFKVRINRSKHLLKQAMLIMKMPQIKSESILEVQYYNEVGTGTGPTNEFYTLVSNEICKMDLDPQLWYAVSDSKNEKSKYINPTNGLMPLPINYNDHKNNSLNFQKKNIYFEFMGSFIAKAILDKKTIEIPLSPLFWKIAFGETPTIGDLKLISPQVYKFLNDCKQLIIKKKLGEENILYNGMDIKHLYIYFTLPGYPKIELVKGGSKKLVTMNNLQHYMNLVYNFFLFDGIMHQINAFKNGFNKLMPISHLKCFSVYEIDTIINGEMETWNEKLLLNSLSCEHGYFKSSKVVQWLVQVLSDLNSSQKKAFLKFCTGSPRLPVGGIANLKPKLTIVKSDRFVSPDQRLPTCMTCVNFLKIPPYSSKKILKEKLLIAINEGQDSFHLS
ncbi:e3 ubiquitin-protein ligase trip12 [Anaeramoeba flamelloides]|uniref:E3 ubiquitin-protein ligase trip12 n=1 Tax=Anaeramoeba flamelloides TaxID=1746091 RepID=A0AAV7ZYD7_9EUKA|nr:e3 ubiquitin-protein ligase trip12 [Anaeramoeba flamelloides]